MAYRRNALPSHLTYTFENTSLSRKVGKKFKMRKPKKVSYKKNKFIRMAVKGEKKSY